MTQQKQDQFILVADLGGTNARFALCQVDHYELCHKQGLATSDFKDIASAIQCYLQQIPDQMRARIHQAAFAVAGPIQKQQVKMTNTGWVLVAEQLAQQFSWQKVDLMNDFAAQAWALLALKEDELVTLGPNRAKEPYATKVVLGPGTGTGVGAVAFAGTQAAIVSGEGGHVSFAPHDSSEKVILKQLQKRFGHVSIERLISGQGIENLYTAIVEANAKSQYPVSFQERNPHELSDASEIVQASLDGDPLCREVLHRFCRILGQAAGDLALTFGAVGGVYITGGIVPKLLDVLAQSEFRTAFLAKGRFQEYLDQIRTQVVIAEDPGLIGVAVFANQHVCQHDNQVKPIKQF